MLATDRRALLSVEVASIESEIGALAVAFCSDRACAASIGHASAREAERRAFAAAQEALQSGRTLPLGDAVVLAPETLLARLQGYAAGGEDDFFDVPLLLGAMTPFQRRVVAACRAIPYGSTRTYGQIAASVGSRGAARAVGQVMASNRIPLLVPCHRVVASGGGLGGFSAPQGVDLKRRLLAMEARAAELSCC